MNDIYIVRCNGREEIERFLLFMCNRLYEGNMVQQKLSGFMEFIEPIKQYFLCGSLLDGEIFGPEDSIKDFPEGSKVYTDVDVFMKDYENIK